MIRNEPISRQVMNPPGDEPEAGNLANTAPLQPDHDGQRRRRDRRVFVDRGPAGNRHRDRSLSARREGVSDTKEHGMPQTGG